MATDEQFDSDLLRPEHGPQLSQLKQEPKGDCTTTVGACDSGGQPPLRCHCSAGGCCRPSTSSALDLRVREAAAWLGGLGCLQLVCGSGQLPSGRPPHDRCRQAVCCCGCGARCCGGACCPPGTRLSGAGSRHSAKTLGPSSWGASPAGCASAGGGRGAGLSCCGSCSWRWCPGRTCPCPGGQRSTVGGPFHQQRTIGGLFHKQRTVGGPVHQQCTVGGPVRQR